MSDSHCECYTNCNGLMVLLIVWIRKKEQKKEEMCEISELVTTDYYSKKVSR